MTNLIVNSFDSGICQSRKTQVFLLATRLALQERPYPKQPKGSASRQVISASVRRAHEMLDEAGPALETSRDLESRTGRNQLIRTGSFNPHGAQATSLSADHLPEFLIYPIVGDDTARAVE